MPPSRMLVSVVGTGLVGSELIAQILSLPSSTSPFKIASIASSKKVIHGPEPAGSWKDLLSKAPSGTSTVDLDELARSLSKLKAGQDKVVLVDNTSSQDVAKSYPSFLRMGINVVTPNKKAFSGPQSLFDEIVAAANSVGGGKWLNEATVGAGLPVIGTLKDLLITGDKILKIEGVFSGTMSYIFNTFSPSSSDAPKPRFSEVVKDARAKGYTEPHPGDDLNGADVARKLTILARMCSVAPSSGAPSLPEGYLSVNTRSLVPEALANISSGDDFVSKLESLDADFDKMREDAANKGCVLRYVGVLDLEKAEVRAELAEYKPPHPLTTLSGSDNMIVFHTARYSPTPLIIQGAGAGAAVTAMGVLSDMFKLV